MGGRPNKVYQFTTTYKNEDLVKKLMNTKNSAGFLIRHIADVELLFAKNVFGASEINVHAKTVIVQLIPCHIPPALFV